MHSDLKILDPIWTTAYIVRNHGYLVWDTLFAMDEKFEVKPQMVDTWKVSDDKLTYTFTLRDGLEWHDGKPVTAEDCVASIKRWGAKDSMGQKLLGVTKEITAKLTRTGSGKDPKGGARVGFEGVFAIKRSEFGMKFMPEGLAEDVQIMLSVEAVKSEK